MEIVRRLYSSLKDGGILFINLPAFESLRQRHDVVYGTPTKREYNTFRNLGSNFNDKDASKLIANPLKFIFHGLKLFHG